MPRLLSVIVCITALLFTHSFAWGQPPAGPSPPSIAGFLKTHCYACHGPDEQKAELRLDTLSRDLTDDAAVTKWVRVYDKLSAGQMPPPDNPQPSKKELTPVIASLQKLLHTSSLERQQKQGRVVLRRLNGTEYENTIRDLLGVQVNVKEMLPEDSSFAGFDNVSAVLDVSATHQLLYQEAAERAVMAAVPQHPIIPFSDKRTGREISTKGPNFQQTLTRSCRLDGDALIIHSKLPRYGLCSTANVPTAGRYRVKMSIGAVGKDLKAVPAAFMTIERSGREDAVLKEIRDIPVGEPQLLEFDFDLKRQQAFVVNLLLNWDIRQFKRPLEEYEGAGLKVEWMSVEGPLDTFPPPSYERLFSGVPLKARSVAVAEAAGRPLPKIAENRTEGNWLSDPLVPASAQPKEDAERLIRDFVPRAFRRPVSDDLIQKYVKRVHAQLDQKASFYDAMIFGYKSILSSPHFLLFTESDAKTLSAQGQLTSARLDQYALANRLSYFLWSTLPDAELMALAKDGKLAEPQTLRAQVERMLAAPQSQRFVDNFVGQWLDLRKIDATIPDPNLYGDFDGTLLWAMPRETKLFFTEILRHDRSLLEFVDSDWGMLNERLAKHYGIPGVEGNEFRKVALPPGSHRGGVMTQASVLKVTADGTQTSPILRGKWVLEKIIGKPPSPPPPDVPTIEPDIRGATTIRQQLDKHRNIAVCASCHVHIDPPGFALESYDPIGGYREFYRVSSRTPRGPINIPNYSGRPLYRGLDVELGGETADGQKFQDIDDYKRILLADKDQLARNLTEKFLIYATGADIQFADRELVDQIVGRLKQKNYGLRTLLHEVVQSRAFLNK